MTKIEELGRYIDDAWKKVWAHMPACFQDDEPGKKKTWFCTKCVEVLQDLVGISPVVAFEFSPAIPVAAIPADLLRQVQSFHVPLIDQAVEESFQDCLAKVPEYLRSEIMREKFVLNSYVAILEKVISDNPGASSFIFEPESAIDSLTDSGERSEAMRVVSEVREAHVPLIKQAVANAFSEDLKRIPEYMRSETFTTSCYASFLQNRYFKIMRSVLDTFDAPVDHQSALRPERSSPVRTNVVASSSSSAGACARANVFVSLKKRLRASTSDSTAQASVVAKTVV